MKRKVLIISVLTFLGLLFFSSQSFAAGLPTSESNPGVIDPGASGANEMIGDKNSLIRGSFDNIGELKKDPQTEVGKYKRECNGDPKCEAKGDAWVIGIGENK